LGVGVQQLAAVARQVVYESEHISVWCYREARIIHHQMHKYCLGQPFREGLSAGTRAMVQHGAIGWLSDDRLNGPIPEDDERWATTTWFPQTKAAGWQYWAMVWPERAVAKLNVKRFIELYRTRGIDAQLFVDPTTAQLWLTRNCRAR
jgi:hypothetical protein